MRAIKGHIEQARIAGESGGDGAFSILNPYGKVATYIQVIASRGMDWDHVSVTIRGDTPDSWFTPTWEEMCYIKGLFFRPDECVMQLHPPESEYINRHPHVLHLWRPQKAEIVRPQFEMAKVMV